MSSLEQFFKECLSSLKRIVRAARGDVTLEDVQNEAWALSAELEARGQPLDLREAKDRDSLIGKLYGRMVSPLRTRVGFAVRLDKNWDDESGDGMRLVDVISAPEMADPLRQLEERQALTPVEVACRESYSQATAYAVCLYRWPDEFSLAKYLCITRDTLRDRVGRCRMVVSLQPTLFDRVERFPEDFCPAPGRSYWEIDLPLLPGEQAVLVF